MQIRLLEEKRTLPRRDFGTAEGENECKTLSSALEEVQHKGTLMERLAILEKRVLEVDHASISFEYVILCTDEMKHETEGYYLS